jgi:hypothetical protein
MTVPHGTTVAGFLVALAKRFEDGPHMDLKLAHHCRNVATRAMAHEDEYNSSRRPAEISTAAAAPPARGSWPKRADGA